VRIPRNLDLGFAATLSVAPCTAYRMLQDFESLQPGDSIIQNGSTSAVGLATIQLARSFGLRSINLLRRRRPEASETDEQVAARLRSLGADEVVFEDQLDDRAVRNRLRDSLPKPKLALNCVGGSSSAALAKLLHRQGTLVTYGGMSKEPVIVPTGLLIFNDIKLRGFWLSSWVNQQGHTNLRAQMIEDLARLHLKGELASSVTFFDFERRWRECVDHATAPYKTTKAVLDFRAGSEREP
jgi:trans-2-enoyl-CoA reductase